MRIASNGNVGIGTTSPANKLTVSLGSYSALSTVASVLNTNSAQKAHVAYDTFLIQQDDAPTLRIYETGENASATISLDSGLTSFAATGEIGLFVNGNPSAQGWTGLNGLQAIRIKANGNVGIGTTNPSYKLQVDAGSNIATFRSVGPGENNKQIVLRSGGDRSIIEASNASDGTDTNLAFNTAGNERMRITSAGYVGIGTTSPGVKLHIQGSNITDSAIRIANSGAGGISWDIYSTNNGFDQGGGKLLFYRTATDGSSGTVVFDSNGNVGIGTIAPSQKLEISASNRTLLKLYNTDFDYGANQSKIDFFGKWWSGAPNDENLHASIVGEHGIGDGYRNGLLRFYVNNYGTMINPMMINYSGNVAIGTSAPDPSAILDLTSTTQGFLPPRMDNSEINAISNPAEGLIVYSTQSKCLFLFDGANWQKIAYA
jgi:hypothetical protein